MSPDPKSESHGPSADEGIERSETGVRILITILYLFAIRIVEMVLLLIVVFDLLYTLITRREPSDEVKRFADRTLTYAVAAIRYITYNEDTAPFPFAPFPPQRDLSGPEA